MQFCDAKLTLFIGEHRVALRDSIDNRAKFAVLVSVAVADVQDFVEKVVIPSRPRDISRIILWKQDGSEHKAKRTVFH